MAGQGPGAMGVERVQAGGIEVKNCKRYCKQCDSGSITGLTTVTPTDTSIRAAGQRHGQGQTDRQAGQGGMGYRHRSERKYCIDKGIYPKTPPHRPPSKPDSIHNQTYIYIFFYPKNNRNPFKVQA